MKSYLSLKLAHEHDLPDVFKNDDVRYPEALVERFLEEYTRPGDTVLDPFAGYGTTLVVAERMGRIPCGVELHEEKAAYARTRLKSPGSMLQGDSRRIETLGLPPIDFSMTSPPYMNRHDLEDPLAAYRAAGKGYEEYLANLQDIYRQVRGLMKAGGRVVIEAANLKSEGKVTTLAWDIAAEVAKSLRFEGEVVVCWDRYGYGCDHSYCLVFSAS
jgi:DNA modification methylase